jgi:hypothetical protein
MSTSFCDIYSSETQTHVLRVLQRLREKISPEEIEWLCKKGAAEHARSVSRHIFGVRNALRNSSEAGSRRCGGFNT